MSDQFTAAVKVFRLRSLEVYNAFGHLNLTIRKAEAGKTDRQHWVSASDRCIEAVLEFPPFPQAWDAARDYGAFTPILNEAADIAQRLLTLMQILACRGDESWYDQEGADLPAYARYMRAAVNDVESLRDRLRRLRVDAARMRKERAGLLAGEKPAPTEVDDYRTPAWYDEHYDIDSDRIRKAAKRGHVDRRGPAGKPRYSFRDMQRYFDAEMLGADGEDSGQIRTERTKPDKQEKAIEAVAPRRH